MLTPIEITGPLSDGPPPVNCVYDGSGHCKTCLKPLRSERIKRNCLGAPQTGPTIINKVANFTAEFAEWKKAGRPYCTLEELRERRSECDLCPLNVNNVCTHFRCGCPLNREGSWRDKQRWRTSTCPLDRWRKLQ